MISQPGPKRSYPANTWPDRSFPSPPAAASGPAEAVQRGTASLVASGFFFMVFGWPRRGR